MRTILEDYQHIYPNHFDLAYDIPRRARVIKQRSSSLIPDHLARNDKPVVLALREITDPEIIECIKKQETIDTEEAIEANAEEATNEALDVKSDEENKDTTLSQSPITG